MNPQQPLATAQPRLPSLQWVLRQLQRAIWVPVDILMLFGLVLSVGL